MRHFNGLRTTADHEMYARSFERYIYEGHAMASPLDSVFAKLKTYMQGIYQHVNNIGGVANPEVKQVFDRMVVQQEAPEQQLVRLLKEAPPVRRLQEAGYSEERGRRAAAMFEQWDREGGTETFLAAMNELRGELPKQEFHALDELSPEAVDSLVKAIRNSNRVRPYEKVRAASAIIKATEGSVPTGSELKLLERVFGKEAGFKKVRKNGIDQILVEIINIPRSLSASIDLSAPLRQGLVAGARHPIIFKRNFMPMVKALRQSEHAKQLLGPFARRPWVDAMHQLRQHDILDRVELRQEMMELVDEAQEVAAEARAAIVVEVGSLFTAQPDRPFEASFEQTDRLEKRRFSRARRAEERNDLARRNRQVYAAQDIDRDRALREAALEIASDENRLTHSEAPGPDRCWPPCRPGRASRGTTGRAQSKRSPRLQPGQAWTAGRSGTEPTDPTGSAR